MVTDKLEVRPDKHADTRLFRIAKPSSVRALSRALTRRRPPRPLPLQRLGTSNALAALQHDSIFDSRPDPEILMDGSFVDLCSNASRRCAAPREKKNAARDKAYFRSRETAVRISRFRGDVENIREPGR